MKKFASLAATAAGVLLSATTAAYSAEETGGWVTSFDGRELRLLNDPNIYIVAPTVDTTSVAPRRTAYLTFDLLNGQRIVTDVVVPDRWFLEDEEDDDEDDEDAS